MAFFGTHDSVTGEKGYGIIKFFKFFGQTQTYTIIEQAKSGVKYFDIRVRKTDRGWICAHGLWETKKTFQQFLKEISENIIHETAYIAVTYEGTLPKGMSEKDFLKFIKKNIKRYENLILYSVSEKYKKSENHKLVWNSIWTKGGLNIIAHYTHFSLTPFPPIPSFWKMEYPEVIPEDDKTIVIVDFYDK